MNSTVAMWIVLGLGTTSGLTALGATFTTAGLPKWGTAILLTSVTASVLLQSFTAFTTTAAFAAFKKANHSKP